MRTLMIRLLVAVIATLGLAGVPAASAKPDTDPCTYLKNTHCHCLSPTGYRSCLILD